MPLSLGSHSSHGTGVKPGSFLKLQSALTLDSEGSPETGTGAGTASPLFIDPQLLLGEKPGHCERFMCFLSDSLLMGSDGQSVMERRCV